MTSKFLAILAIFSFAAVSTAQESQVIEPTYMIGLGLEESGSTIRDSASSTAKLSTERRSQFNCVPESVLVAYVGEVKKFTDGDCDGVAEYNLTVWNQKGGGSIEFGYLMQDQDRIIHSSTTRGIASIDPTYQKQPRFFGKEIEAAMVHTNRSLLDSRVGEFFLIGGEGPLVEKEVVVELNEDGEAVRERLANTSVNPYILDFGPQNCLDFAWHQSTQSLLCVGSLKLDEKEFPGLWIIPRRLNGQLDWGRPQFFWSIAENVRYSGIAADETGIYLFVVATDQPGPLVTSWVVKVSLGRSGDQGIFGAVYDVIGHDLADPTVRQPLVIAKEGLRVVLASYWGNQVTHDIFHVSRDGQTVRPFALGFGKPGGMTVRKIPPPSSSGKG